MARLEQLLGERTIKRLEITKKKATSSIGRELINNLMYRLNRRGNLMVEMDGHYVKRVRIQLMKEHSINGVRTQLLSNFFSPEEKNICIWVKPFIRGNYLMFNWDGVIIRASDIFGAGINTVKL